jgi:hypothetical protein
MLINFCWRIIFNKALAFKVSGHHFKFDLRCHNPILGYSLKIHFFSQNKIKAGNVEKAGREIKM